MDRLNKITEVKMESRESFKKRLMEQKAEKLSTLKRVREVLTGVHTMETFRAWLDIEIDATDEALDDLMETSHLEL